MGGATAREVLKESTTIGEVKLQLRHEQRDAESIWYTRRGVVSHPT